MGTHAGPIIFTEGKTAPGSQSAPLCGSEYRVGGALAPFWDVFGFCYFLRKLHLRGRSGKQITPKHKSYAHLFVVDITYSQRHTKELR